MARVVINNGDSGLTVRNALNNMTAEIYAGKVFPTVANFAALPAASSVPDATYRVTTSTGVWLINRQPKGLYTSNGTTWEYNGDYPTVAADIGFTPASGIGAINTQAAIEEVVSDTATLLAGKAATGAVGSTGVTMATARLLGRSTAGTGAIEEITLGTGLSFSGTTLNASGGGAKVMAVISSPYTLTSTVSAQAIFPSPSSVTLGVGVYRYETILLVTSMSATSGNASIGPAAGTATIAAIAGASHGIDQGTVNARGTRTGQVTNTLNVLPATATGATSLGVAINGTFEVTAAGTVTPIIALDSAAPAVVGVGSFFLIEYVGAISSDRVGTWS